MITYAEETAFMEAINKIAHREYQRGLEMGWGIAAVAVNWLRMTPHSYSHEEIADMIELRLTEEKRRAGL